MRERACTFGSHGGLVGILCEPDRTAVFSGPAVLLFNVGLEHHVGPHRLNVDLSRHLAGLGFLSLRFDLSGLGDSTPRRDGRSDVERAVVDVGEAMDFLTRRKGVTSFVIMALCSGVDPTHTIAVGDSRVVGAVFMDGYAYDMAPGRLRRLTGDARRLLTLGTYRRWLRRHLWSRLGPSGRSEVGVTPVFQRTYPPLAQFKDDVRSMLARGVEVFFLYTGDGYFFTGRSRFDAMIGEASLPDGIEVEHWQDLDHVLTPVLERRRAIRRLGEWMVAHFGARLEVDTPTLAVDRSALAR